MRAHLFLLGYCDLIAPIDQAARLFNLCHRGGFVYTPLGVPPEQGWVGIRCRLRTGRALMVAAAQEKIPLKVQKEGGLPCLLEQHRQRVGLLVGGGLALLVLCLACGVIWDVRVEGEGDIDTEGIRRELVLCGLREGRRISSLDTDEIESLLLTRSGEVAWVSVNIKGTVAYVQARPLLKPEAVQVKDPLAGANLVAAYDGRIESVRLLQGEVVVHPGDMVRAGQLLISGVRDMGDGSFDTMEARGEVLALTEHEMVVEIPLCREQKVYTGAKNVQKTLFFFGKSIKITKSTGIMEGNCDTIKRMENICLFGLFDLPLAIEIVEYLPYEMQTVTVTPEAASEEAYAAMSAELSRALEGATLLSKRMYCEVTDERCVLRCRYRCIENIAAPRPFSIGAPTRDASGG